MQINCGCRNHKLQKNDNTNILYIYMCVCIYVCELYICVYMYTHIVYKATPLKQESKLSLRH